MQSHTQQIYVQLGDESRSQFIQGLFKFYSTTQVNSALTLDTSLLVTSDGFMAGYLTPRPSANGTYAQKRTMLIEQLKTCETT